MKKTKVTTIVGTRPEIIRLSSLIKKLDQHFDHRLIHTNQNSDTELREIFFTDLELRQPDIDFKENNSSLGTFLGNLFKEVERELTEHRPDAVVILGDTNSALSAIIAKRLGIPVYHLEAGNRSFDQNVPEEINRKIVDHTSDFNLVYTELARSNLVAEGIHPRRIALIGSPLFEVLNEHRHRIEKSSALKELGLVRKNYILVSLHRQENVDQEKRLRTVIDALEYVAEIYKLPILVSLHPRTKEKTDKLSIRTSSNLIFHKPFGFLDYCNLQINSRIVLSDSGSISEESSILRFPAVTIRDSMERPEALEAGTILLSGISGDQIVESIRLAESSGLGVTTPIEYTIPDTSTRVINFLLSTAHQHLYWSGLRGIEQ
jgi:UDP-N-acetylglucosamine 2-epimerase (non-hydrolysing)